jgi:hypothetical protein
LWVLHTYVYEAYPQTPHLAITSPDKGCAKTQVLEVIELVVRQPWRTVVPSEAVPYRYIHRHQADADARRDGHHLQPQDAGPLRGPPGDPQQRQSPGFDRAPMRRHLQHHRAVEVFCPKALAVPTMEMGARQYDLLDGALAEGQVKYNDSI